MRVAVVPMLLLTLLVGCQTARGVRQPSPQTPPAQPPAPMPPMIVQPPPTASSEKLQIPDVVPPAPEMGSPAPLAPATDNAALLATYPQSADSVSGPAVVALLKKAGEARAAGVPSQASAALERALRIEPRNYFVWSALAGAYLDSKNYEQAESVARKSNSLARGNVYVEQANWRVIHDARAALGDAEGAQAAQAHVDAIQLLLTPPAPEAASTPVAPQ